jgi:PAS domain S-box-containing protein
MNYNAESTENNPEQWKVIIEKLPVPALVSAGKIETVLLVNHKFEETFGYTIQDMPDVHHWWPLAYPDPAYRRQVAEQWSQNLDRAIAEQRELDPVDVRVTCKDGTVRYVTVYAYSFGKLHIVLFSDITRIEDARRSLEKALEEKEELMRELNHRVKNNLMIISSLISLKTDHPDTGSALRDISRQIDAIRIVHEKLYKSNEVSSIHLRDYFQDLLKSVFGTFAGRNVTIENLVEDVTVPANLAVSLGLVVNEAATNAIKHGFCDEQEAVFTLTLQKAGIGPAYSLTLENNGNPFTEKITKPGQGGFGMQLMDSLVQQMSGKLEISRTPALKLCITFRTPIKAI